MNFTLRGLTLSGGQDASGGSLYISQGAAAVLTNCTFVGNRAVGANGSSGANGASGLDGGNGGNGTGGGSGFGGAIHNLGNLTALLTHCGRGNEMIVGDRAHMFVYEAGGSAALGGVHPRTQAQGAALPLPSTFTPGVPEGLDKLLLRGLHPRPELRYGSADEMARELKDMVRLG